MTSRTITLKNYSDVESLKKFILQKLNLFDHKKDSVAEFELRVKNFIDRNQNLRLFFLVDHTKIEKELRFKLSLTHTVNQKYPYNFQMGNPHNRWLFDPIIKTEDEVNKEKAELEKDFNDKLSTLKDFLSSLEKLGNGQITINEGGNPWRKS